MGKSGRARMKPPQPHGVKFRRAWTWSITGIGLLWAARAAIDPRYASVSFWGPISVAGVLLAAALLKKPWKPFILPCLLAIVFAVSAHMPVQFRADSALYYSYLRSMAFDGDIDYSNEWKTWGYEVTVLTEAGMPANAQSVGPAIIWSPFFALADLYVRLDTALGSARYPANGYSAPYRRSTALGTLTLVVIGAVLLTQMMARRQGWAVSALAVAGTVLASPVPYYAFLVPAMAHGVTFGVAAIFLWTWDRTRRKPSLTSWTALGLVFGLLLLCRWQAALYGFFVLLLISEMIASRSVRILWLLSSAAASLVVFFPQVWAWKTMYGSWLLVPQGGRFLDWTAPNLTNVLISANHGFFNWTPLMFFCVIGLAIGLRKDLQLSLGGIGVFLATAWVNGSITGPHWSGDDAFGPRRFVLIVPLMAVGMVWFLEAAKRVLARAPMLAPAGLILIMVLWNIGFIHHFQARKYPEAAPLERLAKDQAKSLRLAVQDLLGWIAGDDGRALAYKFFSAEYFYTRFNRSGTINLRRADEKYLLHGWWTASRRTAKRTFRRALFPEACVRIPLEEPFDLRVAIDVRAPDGVNPQIMTIAVNDRFVSSSPIHQEWGRVSVVIPEDHLVPGENALCFRFSNALPEEKGRRVAAYFEKIQLP